MTDVRLIHGDCLEILPTLNGVDAVVTDPPYGIALKNHDTNRYPASLSSTANRSYIVPGDESKNAGTAALQWCESRELPTITFASPWNPWPGKWRNLIVWDKGGGVGGGGDLKTCLKRSWELIQVARNGPMNGCRDVSVWRHVMTLTSSSDHICAKPVPLMERLVERFTNPGDTVLDPFMGSGTTGVACVNTGRNFIGIELDAGYFAIARERIDKAQAAKAELLIA